jgi:hypothetical protein
MLTSDTREAGRFLPVARCYCCEHAHRVVLPPGGGDQAHANLGLVDLLVLIDAGDRIGVAS